MPTKQGGRALKNASTSDRCSFRRNTALPAASTPCSWKTRLAMSKPTVVIFMVDGSFSSLHSTARAWHIDAVRGRPPHQIRSTSRLLKKSAKGAVFDDFWEVSQKSDRKPPLKTLAFWTRCGVYAPFERAKKSYFNNLLGHSRIQTPDAGQCCCARECRRSWRA